MLPATPTSIASDACPTAGEKVGPQIEYGEYLRAGRVDIKITNFIFGLSVSNLCSMFYTHSFTHHPMLPTPPTTIAAGACPTAGEKSSS